MANIDPSLRLENQSQAKLKRSPDMCTLCDLPRRRECAAPWLRPLWWPSQNDRFQGPEI